MPQTLAEMIRDSQDRVLADIRTFQIIETLLLERLREAQALIAQWLAKVEKKKPASPRTSKGRHKAATSRD